MIVLDTHVLVWYLSEPSKLSKKSVDIIDTFRSKGILVSSISVWEICLLVRMGRLQLELGLEEWIRNLEALPFVRFVPVDNAIALRSNNLLEPFHADPADRMIVATALEMSAKLVTSDRKILDYPHVKTVG